MGVRDNVGEEESDGSPEFEGVGEILVYWVTEGVLVMVGEGVFTPPGVAVLTGMRGVTKATSNPTPTAVKEVPLPKGVSVKVRKEEEEYTRVFGGSGPVPPEAVLNTIVPVSSTAVNTSPTAAIENLVRERDKLDIVGLTSVTLHTLDP